MLSKQQSSYRQIVKATSIFGGVQVVNIIVTIVRSKALAVLLGPAGMGIAGLLNTTVNLVSSLTNFGLSTSAVKNVAAANASANELRVAIVVAVLRRLVWITGLLGALVTFVAAPWLSELTFGTADYTYAFMWLSVTLLLAQLSSGQIVILRGLRKIQYMAKASVTGSILGLIFSIPIYFVWGIEGIVPAIIVSSVVALSLSWFFASKISVPNVTVDREVLSTEGREMLSMGFMLSLSGLITLGASYITRIFISNVGGVEEVGLYTAGFAMVNSYVGMVFTAMSTDFYPRLSAVAQDRKIAANTVNQQIEVSILILAPILLIFLVFVKWVIYILYSTEFGAVSAMIHWAALSIFFKAVSWCIGFIILANGESKVYFLNELVTNVYILGLNVLGYHLGGLEGLGISFLMAYILYLVQVFILTKVRYEFHFSKSFYTLFVGQLVLGILAFLLVKFTDGLPRYLIGTVLIIISAVYSFKGLDSRMNLTAALKGITDKFKK